MTQDTKHGPRRAALPAATLAALLLAGCSSGHIGESWQCPLAEGGSCESVAAADPAVPGPVAARNAALGEPLWRVRDGGRPEAPAEMSCQAACGGAFDPFAWLMWLFGKGNDGAGDRSAAKRPEPAPATAAAESEAPSALAAPEAELASPAAPESAEPRPAEPAAAALPAEPPSLQAEPSSAEDGPQADDLRTGEVVARIWIAPFVDANGVYREAGHVRVVLEPAGWRLK